MAPDPKRAVYAKFANAGIPRNYVINREGKILYQSIGYSPEDFQKMKSILEKELESEELVTGLRNFTSFGYAGPD